MRVEKADISAGLARMLARVGREDLIENGFELHDDTLAASRAIARNADHAIFHALFDRGAPHAGSIRRLQPAAEASAPATAAAPDAAIPSAIAAPRRDEARLTSWLQTVLLLAILIALLCGQARAQTAVAPMTTAATGGSALTSFTSSAASTNATSVKAGPGNVYTIRMVNTTATLYYLRMYNLATAPTCSSATGFVETIPIPASATGAGIAITQYPQGYTTGIAFCLTGGPGSTDNTNAATGVFVTVLYK